MPRKILVVEDEEDYRSLLVRVLSDAGYAVVAASNGADGMREYAAQSPDLVLLDVQLPDVDGFELCRRIRAEGPRPNTPVVFCTVRSAVVPVAEGLRAGGNGYLLKPFTVENLLERVRAALAP